MTTKPIGNKTGPRGHWPRGKRRHTPSRDWPELRLRLVELLAVPDRSSGRSKRALATRVGVTAATICRWLSGEDMPDAAACRVMRNFARKHEAENGN
jgi:transposase-like protein